MTGSGRPPRSKRSGSLRLVPPPGAGTDHLEALLERFCGRYPNVKTAADYRSTLRRLFDHACCRDPAELTEDHLLRFCTAGDPANNTVYQRTTKVVTFLRWCHRTGLIEHDPGERLRERDSPLRTYRRTYGKVQARNPGRWLSHDEAFGRLVDACRDGTIVGLRDEIVVRLGLTGLRLSEIAGLRLRNLSQVPTLTWTGKGRKPRQATLGRDLTDALNRYLAAYPTPEPAFPLICRQVLGAARQGGQRRIDWAHPVGNRGLFGIVTARAEAAGLGHVAPHDLRRTAAGILHRATGGDGSHHFDLLDIQRVLGHSDPATTMRSYLAPMDTDVFVRASAVLD